MGAPEQISPGSSRRSGSAVYDVFLDKYLNDGFAWSESLSGPGSSLVETAKLRAELPPLLSSLEIETLIDAACGDMNWTRHLDYDFRLYIGVDVVEPLIDRLRRQFPEDRFRFLALDICDGAVPDADAILCRDCLVHLPYSLIISAVRVFKRSGAKFLLTTTFPEQSNTDIAIGEWRALNFQAEPFAWPPPLKLIRERFPDAVDPWNDKSLGVWPLASIPA